MTEIEAQRYLPIYLLRKGYKPYLRKFTGIAPEYWQDVETSFDGIVSSMIPSRLFFLFKKGTIKITWGLFAKGHPPKVTSIFISDRKIYSQIDNV